MGKISAMHTTYKRPLMYVSINRESLDDSDEPGSGIITETVGSYTDEVATQVADLSWLSV